METWKNGDRVFAFWEEDGYWYPATISRIDGDEIHVAFGDNRKAVTDEDGLFEFSVEPDDLVESWSASDEKYYPAQVTAVKDERVQVEFEDGSKEWTSLDNLRYEAEGEWEEGDRVFAYYEDDEYWYPATILNISEEEEIEIRYDDGEEETTDADYLLDLILDAGDGVEARWSKDNEYYDAEVLEVKGEKVHVKFEDGESEWTDIANVRFLLEEEEE